jgi:hypothetical protein
LEERNISEFFSWSKVDGLGAVFRSGRGGGGVTAKSSVSNSDVAGIEARSSSGIFS